MKIPSVQYINDVAFKSAKRFPLTLLSAFIGVAIGVYLIEFESTIDNKFPLINLMLVSGLGLTLFFCVSIYQEKQSKLSLPSWFMNLIGFAILVLIYLSLPNENDTSNLGQPYIRYIIYNVAFHLLVSFAPFISKNEINGFWQYNKMLFLRFCLSILYSGFVYIGITLALTALNLLFDAEIKGETFFQLFVVVIGIFNTWFFISGINADINSLEEEKEYPKGLKVFTQYVLLPLLILYLIILYAYMAKVIGLWDWPKGIVSYLIVCVSILGILAFLLIYPFGEKEENNWISKFSKIYYFTLIPLAIVLFVAIGIRLGDYGFTVNRYIITELGVWLAFISIYFILGNKNIKIIPVSLTLLILLTSFGPWGMFKVSEKSQIERLTTILKNAEVLKEDKIVNEPVLKLGKDSLFFLSNKWANQALLNDSLKNEVYSIVNYIDDFHSFRSINHWYKQNPDSVHNILKDSSKFYTYAGQPKVRMELMGLKYDFRYNSSSDGTKFRTYNVKRDLSRITKTTGYDYILRINHYQDIENSVSRNKKIFSHDDDVFQFSNNDYMVFTLTKAQSDSLHYDLAAMLEKLQEKYKDKSSVIAENSELILFDSAANISGKLQIENISIVYKDSLEIQSFTGKLFIKLH